MSGHRSPTSPCALLASLFFATAAFAQTSAVDMTPVFVENGAVIEGLTAVRISDIIVLRGRTNDPEKAKRVTRIANSLGYTRVANLIAIRDDATDDKAIEYTAQRRLELEPALQDCVFHVDSNRGTISLTGHVHQETQIDLAMRILRRIDGVKEIHNDLAPL